MPLTPRDNASVDDAPPVDWLRLRGFMTQAEFRFVAGFQRRLPDADRIRDGVFGLADIALFVGLLTGG